jgi:hypothetical protein
MDEEDDILGEELHKLWKGLKNPPELFDGLLNRLLKKSLKDKLPVVKWHLVMVFMNLNLSKKKKQMK